MSLFFLYNKGRQTFPVKAQKVHILAFWAMVSVTVTHLWGCGMSAALDNIKQMAGFQVNFIKTGCGLIWPMVVVCQPLLYDTADFFLNKQRRISGIKSSTFLHVLIPVCAMWMEPIVLLARESCLCLPLVKVTYVWNRQDIPSTSPESFILKPSPLFSCVASWSLSVAP